MPSNPINNPKFLCFSLNSYLKKQNPIKNTTKPHYKSQISLFSP